MRATLITPLFALGVFGVANYSRERRLAEQYAFKAVSASTVEGSIALLDRSLDGISDELKHEKVTDFAIETVKCIHQEPQELVKATKHKVNAGNKLLQVGGELNETMETLNENLEGINHNGITK